MTNRQGSSEPNPAPPIEQPRTVRVVFTFDVLVDPLDAHNLIQALADHLKTGEFEPGQVRNLRKAVLR